MNIDMLIGEDGDLMIFNGDISIGDSNADMVERLLAATPGEFKFSPVLGVGAIKALGSNGKIDNIKVKLIEDMKRNDINYKGIEVTNDDINVIL